MNVCACKAKSSKESMRQNAQQHDTKIDSLVLQMLLPLHCLHLLISHWCLQMPLPPHCFHLLLFHWCLQMLLPPHFLQRLLARPLVLTDVAPATGFALAPLPLLLVQSTTRMYIIPQPPKHIPCLGAVELFLGNSITRNAL